MKNYKIPLPKHLQSDHGKQSDINFSMSHRHYEINGEQFENPLKDKFTHSFRGYIHNIMNDIIIITLFYENDIITPI